MEAKTLRPKTDTTPYKGHFVLYCIVFAIAIIVFIASALLAHGGKATGWEYTWFRDFNNWSESWGRFMKAATFLGSAWMAAIAVVIVFFARYYRLALRLSLSITGGYGLAYLAKSLVERERPVQLLNEVHVRMSESGMGFPSAHATIAAIITLTLLPYMPWKWRWIIPLVIVSVCFSRLYLGVHLPLDVIGGVALGTAVVSFVRVLPQSLRVFLRID